MIMLLFGLLDLYCAIIFMGVNAGWFAFSMYSLVPILYLGGKAVIYRGDFASMVDGMCAVFLIFMLFGLRHHLIWIVIFYLGQKGFFSVKGFLFG